MMLAVVLFLGAQETLVLKEKARVEGRYVRVLDLVDAEALDHAARAKLAAVYVGRAPEEGKARTVESDEVLKALEREGYGPVGLSGERVEVTAAATAVPIALRESVAAAVKAYVLARRSDLRAGQVAVRVSFTPGQGCPAGARVAGVSSRREPDFGSMDFAAALVTADGRKAEMPVTAQIERVAGAAAAAGAVKKGEIVRAVGARFEVDARALQDGGVGEEIALEVVASRARIRGRVVEPGRVDVEGGR